MTRVGIAVGSWRTDHQHAITRRVLDPAGLGAIHIWTIRSGKFISSLPPMRFHDLRHTAATLLLGSGVHPKIVSEMLGHSQIAITLDLYSHVTPTTQRESTAATGRRRRSVMDRADPSA
jgi:integrase